MIGSSIAVVSSTTRPVPRARSAPSKGGAYRHVVATAVALACAGCNVIFGQTDLEIGGGGGDAGSADTSSAATSDPVTASGSSSTGLPPECPPDYCGAHGSCSAPLATPGCTCEAHFDGERCERCADGYAGDACTACADGFQDADDDGSCLVSCGGSPCANDGVCDDASGERVCTCRPGFGGDDCEIACDVGTAGTDCDFRVVYGVDLPASDLFWFAPADVPYDVEEAATVGAFDRVAYRLILDDEEVWVEMDDFTDDASSLGVPVDAIFDQTVTNVVVRSLAANQPTLAAPSPGYVEMWSDCYEEGADGAFDDDDERTGGPDCYGSMQVHVAGSPVLVFNRFAQGDGTFDLGIGNGVGVAPVGNADWTFAGNSASFTTRRLEVWVREE